MAGSTSPGSPNTAKDSPEGVQTEPKVCKRGHPKNDAKSNAEKELKNIEKLWQNDTKTEAEMDEKTM